MAGQKGRSGLTTQVSGETVKKYLEKFPDLPDRTLARKIYNENKELFTTVETCRASVRMYRGHNSEFNKNRLSENRFIKPLTVYTPIKKDKMKSKTGKDKSKKRKTRPRIQGELVKEYLLRFKNVKDRTIANKIFNENKTVFKTYENCRSAVRYYRGHKGSDARGKIADTEFVKPITHDRNPFNLPESYANIREDYKLPKAATNILMISDIHFPYQENEVLSLILQYGVDKKVNTIYLNGDIIDMYQASFHEKDPRVRSIKAELDTVRAFFDVLKNTFPNAKIYYKEGNHEARLSRYLRVKAPELLDCEEFELPSLLKLGERGIEWIPNIQAVKIGKLYALHGNEFKGGGGVNPARAYYLKSKVSMIAGDKHRTSEHTEQSLNGEIVTCWSTACCCELNPHYMPYNTWNWGAAHIIVHPDGDFNVTNFRIIKTKQGVFKVV